MLPKFLQNCVGYSCEGLSLLIYYNQIGIVNTLVQDLDIEVFPKKVFLG